MSMTWFEITKEAENILKNEYKETYKSELYSILVHCFNISKIDLLIKENEQVERKIQKKFFEVVNLRMQHIPLQYILGYWYFMDLKFKVGGGVLIPREDTSVLVSKSFEYLKNIKNPKVIDLCSGSGCIAISLKKKIGMDSKVYAAEISRQAFSYLQKNISLNKCEINAINKNIFEITDDFKNDFFDAAISNPPYVKTGDLDFLQKEVKKEPTLALDGGEDGLYFYKKISKMWVPKIKKGGILAFEVGINQALKVRNIMEGYGMKFIKIFKDMNNVDRVVIGIKS